MPRRKGANAMQFGSGFKSIWIVSLAALLYLPHTRTIQAKQACVSNYNSIQEAIDANPGRMVNVPAGDYEISKSIVINKDGSGLFGSGRIIQTDPKQAIVRVQNAERVRIKDLTLTRPEGKKDAEEGGIMCEDCVGLEIDGVYVLDNRSPVGGIRLTQCLRATIRDCTVENYKTPAIDDRTNNPDPNTYKYAFKCIDGTGIVARHSEGTIITGNRIIESVYLPTKEIHDKYELGKIITMEDKPGRPLPKEFIETRHTNNWHQGSGLIVTGLGHAQYSIVSNNYILNAAQGLDIHSDNVIISGNIVDHAMMGMKAMHGSKHVLIDGNQFSHCDIWGVMLMPGSASHRAGEPFVKSNRMDENIDGGTIVSNNIFSFFCHGDQYWNWENAGVSMLNPIALLGGQMPDNPPLRDVVITGNVVYDNGRDKLIVDGEPKLIPPRYHYAIYVEQNGQPIPEGVKIFGNILHPGSKGVSNVKLPLNP